MHISNAKSHATKRERVHAVTEPVRLKRLKLSRLNRGIRSAIRKTVKMIETSDGYKIGQYRTKNKLNVIRKNENDMELK